VPRIILGDDQRLAQVITNLLSNAVKFTPEEGRISLGAFTVQEEGGLYTIQVEVTDTGIGITDEQKERLFNSFEQADGGTSRKFGGTGLGLAISKRIVELMDGSIWIESEPGQGSTFAFTIKVPAGEELQEESKTSAEGPGASEGVYLGDHWILLAEDVEINREIVITLLEPTGLRIEVAENGLEVLEKYRANPGKYGAILMDVQMPDLDGYEATRRIREFEESLGDSNGSSRKVPIIAMTANVFREDIERCISSGMNDHVAKPLDIKILIKKLRACLEA